MNRLRTRLMISYVVVLGVTLAVIGVFLVILLRGQPVAREPIVAQLTVLANGVAQRELIAGLLINAAPTRLETALDRVASNANTRVIAAQPDGTIIYNSLGVLPGGQRVAFQLGPESSAGSGAPGRTGGGQLRPGRPGVAVRRRPHPDAPGGRPAALRRAAPRIPVAGGAAPLRDVGADPAAGGRGGRAGRGPGDGLAHQPGHPARAVRPAPGGGRGRGGPLRGARARLRPGRGPRRGGGLQQHGGPGPGDASSPSRTSWRTSPTICAPR